ncbi:MAG: hypothetical protein J6S67_08335 [Methanobrevibacter sp.]|nr:hypothetical protein [Methanobrevibacter sp.]
MELYTLKINVTNQRLSFGENPPEIFSGDQSIDFVEFTFTDDSWNFPNIWAIFSRQKGASYQIALDDNKVMIPAEVMQKRGYVYIGLMATDGENVQTSSVLQYSIRQGAANVDTIAPSPNIYEQFLADLDAYQEAIHNLQTLAATAETLPAGSDATASFDNGVLELGIPKGDTGATGNGIQSITKTSTSGSVDTYTITFTNGSTTTFTVTNGEVTEAELNSVIDSLEFEINDLYNQEYAKEVASSGNTWFSFNITLGKTYVFKNTSTSAVMVAHTLAQPSGYDYIEQIGTGSILPGNTVIFVPTIEAKAIVVYSNGAGSFEVKANLTLTELKSDINNLDKKIDDEIQLVEDAIATASDIPVNLILEQGGINGANGQNANSNTDIRTESILYGNGTYSVNPNGQKVYVFYYNSTGSFTGTGAWAQTSDFEFTISNGGGFRLAITKIDSTEFKPDENLVELFLQNIIADVIDDVEELETLKTTAFQPYSLCKFISHQGYPLDGDTLGHCIAGQYIKSAQKGFNMAEGDLKFTSDIVPVLCHDDSFTDSVSGNTITISNVTYAQLITYNYYDTTVASLDEVLGICRQYGLDFVIDQFSYANNQTKQKAVFDAIAKHRMEDNVVFVVYTTDTEALIDDIYNWYPDARVQINCALAIYTTDAINTANAYYNAGKFKEIIIGTTFATNGIADTLTLLQSLNSNKELGIKVLLWMSDVISWITPFLPYVDYYVSNKISNKTLITGGVG